MAFAVLFSISEITDQILRDNDHYPISVYGKQQIASLHKQVSFLGEYLAKFPEHGRSFETRIRYAANEAEDVIEHFMYEQIKSNAAAGAIGIQFDLIELKTATDELSSISGEIKDKKKTGSMRLPAIQPAGPSSPSPSPSPSTVDGVTTVGLEEDLKKIQDLVCRKSTKRQIIPIMGMGGIGKTTLAKKVYNDPLIRGRFAVRAWLTISQDHNTQNIFSNLLQILARVDPELYNQADYSAKDRVYRILKGRKYFIVLDDVWSTNALDDILRIFPDDSNGSQILITTRLESVASDIAFSPPHRMHLLDQKQSWNLLKQKVFPNKECPPSLEMIGKNIATNCGGLPLAIVVIAGILSADSESLPSWEKVAKDARAIIQKDAWFERVMSLSYTHLPHHLRPCLLYMGCFPEDYEIRVSKLIKLWIAEGFIVPTGKKSLEDVAEEYLEDLVRRSLALPIRNKSNGKIKSCSVHDLMRDLCRTIATDENFERRLSIDHPDLRCLAKAYGSTLRSVICFHPTESDLIGIRKLRLLRVLDVVDTDAYSLPPQVFDLFHLRYLAFACSMEIPTAISRLQNLRTLIIRPSKRLIRRYSMVDDDQVYYLPVEIWNIPLLSHLVSFFDALPNPEGAVSPLEKLLTLSEVKKLICTEEMMEMIPNVKKLGITYFGDKFQEDYQLQNLVLLEQLEKLTLVLRKGPLIGVPVNPVFPKTLRKLTLSGWRLPWEYMRILASLPNLQVLKLRDFACQGNMWETYQEMFPSLEFLLIDESDLKIWDTDRSHFPRLKRLVLYRCPSLSEIPENIGDIATLQLIEVDHANQSLVECVKQIQEDQHDFENDLLQVRCLHYQEV